MIARCLLLSSAVLTFMSVAAGVQASPFSVTVNGPTGADGAAGLTLMGDTTMSTGDFKYDESEQAPDFIHFLSTNFDDTKAAFTISNITRTRSSIGGIDVFADFLVSDPDFDFVVTNTNGTSQTITGYSLRFSAEVFYAPGGIMPIGSTGSSPALLIPPPSIFTTGTTATLTGTVFSPVPLPASAPLFGAAVAVLGMAGYMTNRRRTAETA